MKAITGNQAVDKGELKEKNDRFRVHGAKDEINVPIALSAFRDKGCMALVRISLIVEESNLAVVEHSGGIIFRIIETV